MKTVLRNLLPLAVVVAILTMTACEHKELCYEHPHTTDVHVVFDWNYAPDAEQNNEVEGMCLWFYPMDDDRNPDPIYINLRGMKGGKVEIPTGRYHVLYYNNDYRQVLFRGTDEFYAHECYTRSTNILEPINGNAGSYGVPRAKGTENERVVLVPEMMWGDNAMDVEITENSIKYWFVRDGEKEVTTISNNEKKFTLMPHEQVCEYTYEIINVENLKYVTQLSASISGMSGSVFCAKEELHDECVTLPLEAVSDKVSTITGKFHTFGHHDENDERHILTLYVWYEDGSKYYYDNDVTEQVDNAPDKRNVHIVVDGLKLPKPIVNGGGLQPDVTEWEHVDEVIEM